jgi:L-lactate dehydrogenase complex protein LldG
MIVERDAFLARVRGATGGRTPAAPPVFLSPSARADRAATLSLMAQRWRREGAAWYHVVPADVGAAVSSALAGARVRRAVLSADPLLASLGVAQALEAVGIACVDLPRSPDAVHAVLPQVDAGVTVVAYGVAETGTLVEVARPTQPQSLSLVPRVHVAVLPTLDDLFAALGDAPVEHALTLISGPSGTADIALQHVTGVHGPEYVHVVLVDEAAPRTSPDGPPAVAQ